MKSKVFQPTGRLRPHHPSKLVPNIGARCRGALSWKGEADWATDESCQSGSLHEIPILEPYLKEGKPTRAVYPYGASPDYSCTADELGKSWANKIDLIEEGHIQAFELRSVDVGHEVL